MIIRKVRSVVLWVVMAYGASLMLYGFMRFPDAPLHACAAETRGEKGYCGKTGLAHTQAEFDSFGMWHNLLLYSWPVVCIAVFILNRDYKKARAARNAPEAGEP
jgi:hypothetical protein